MSTVYFCWICECPIEGPFGIDSTVQSLVSYTDTHYESGQQIFFCGAIHWLEYRKLKDL
jgi:hypothetical protein